MVGFLACPPETFSQLFQTKGNPEIINYSPTQFKGHRQTWGAASSTKSRKMFFANSNGLLEYDGSTWILHPTKQILRSVFISNEDEVYTGSLGEFGKWKRLKDGKMRFISLLEPLKNPALDNETFWNIIQVQEGILFQSFAYAFILKPNGRIVELKLPNNIRFFGKGAKNQVFVQGINERILQLKNSKLEPLEGSGFLKNENIASIIPNGNETLFVTERSVWKYDGINFRKFNAALNSFAQTFQLNKALKVSDNCLAFGSIQNGIVVTDSLGNILYHVNKINGIGNNTVLSLSTDFENNLWVGLDIGICMLNLSSPLRYFTDILGDIGTVFDVAKFGEYLYIGTNHGLFASKLSEPSFKFRLIPNSQGLVWNLTVANNQLICGHNNGTYLVDGFVFKQISNTTGGWDICTVKGQNNHLLQGTYTHLLSYRLNSSKQWELSGEIKGFSKPVKQLVQDDEGYFWANVPMKGISKISIDSQFENIISEIVFDHPEFQQNSTRICKINGKVYALTTKGLSTISAHPKKVSIPSELSDRDDNLAMVRENERVRLVIGNKAIENLPYFADRGFNEGSEKIKLFDGKYLFFCLENGFSFAELNQITNLSESKQNVPKIAQLSVENMPQLNRANLENIVLPYNANNIRVRFSPGSFSKNVVYQYKLDGKEKGSWSERSSESGKTFLGLSPGDYTLSLKSNISTETDTIKFTIQPPWYWNGWSKTVYLLVFCLINYVIFLWHKSYLKQQQDSLEKKHRQEVALKEQEITKLENEKLHQEVIRKSEELANTTMSLIKRNEAFGRIKDEITSKQEGNTASVLKLIDKNLSAKEEWKVFETNFNQVHETFLKKLIEKYPHLSHGDLKLAAYLRMNLSSKEIAQLLNITIRGVELKRYRLRKKIELETDENLNDFMMRI